MKRSRAIEIQDRKTECFREALDAYGEFVDKLREWDDRPQHSKGKCPRPYPNGNRYPMDSKEWEFYERAYLMYLTDPWNETGLIGMIMKSVDLYRLYD